MSTGPRLRTTHRLLERPAGEVQLGLGDDALVLTGATPALVDLLRRLDGTTTLETLEAHCASTGLARESLHTILGILDEAGALDRAGRAGRGHHRTTPFDQVDALVELGLDDETALNRLLRARRSPVLVLGRGLIAEHIAEGLRGLTERVDHRERLAPGDHLPDAVAVVFVADEALDPGLAAQALLVGPTLPVVTRARATVLGPWHSDAADPCPLCLDLRRTDADEAWPHLIDQLRTPASSPARGGADPVTRALVVATCLQWVRRHLVGLAETRGLTCEVDAWQLGMTHRVWPVHPRCTRHEVDLALGA